MNWLDAIWILALIAAVIAIGMKVGSMQLAQSDRYILMRISLMKIARGQYENANALAQQTLDTVNDIDDERVRQFHESHMP